MRAPQRLPQWGEDPNRDEVVPMMDWGDIGGGNGMMGFGMMGFGWILATLLLIGLITVSVMAATGMFHTARPGPTPPDGGTNRTAAEAELELRYARGELDAAALAQARSVLRQR